MSPDFGVVDCNFAGSKFYLHFYLHFPIVLIHRGCRSPAVSLPIFINQSKRNKQRICLRNSSRISILMAPVARHVAQHALTCRFRVQYPIKHRRQNVKCKLTTSLAYSEKKYICMWCGDLWTLRESSTAKTNMQGAAIIIIRRELVGKSEVQSFVALIFSCA